MTLHETLKRTSPALRAPSPDGRVNITLLPSPIRRGVGGEVGVRRVVILGSTGSIGVNALGVLKRLGKAYQVVGLSARRNMALLLKQMRQFEPDVISVWEESDARAFRAQGIIVHGKPLVVLSGLEGLMELAGWGSADTVLSSVVGAVGLRPLLAAIRGGKTVALANKEALIMAGELVVGEARRWNATLLPVDSEHSALFQCLNGERSKEVRRLILTASGGPFYRTKTALDRVTVRQALAHPTWKMGRKITIDSATLMNKGIEILEASILFGISLDQVEVVIHPQSIVHSLVEFTDGAVLAQLSHPDMRLPIQYALSFPERWAAPGPIRVWRKRSWPGTAMPPKKSGLPNLAIIWQTIQIAKKDFNTLIIGVHSIRKQIKSWGHTRLFYQPVIRHLTGGVKLG